MSARHNSTVICFDAFGTLVPQGRRGRSPYQLLSEAATLAGISNWRHYVLTCPLDPRAIADCIGAPEQSTRLEMALEREMEGLALFPGVAEMLDELHRRGAQLWVCSNLAKPYGVRLRTLLPEYVQTLFSYEIGYTKPAPEIYRRLIQRAGVAPERIWFFGDSERSDVVGPQNAGMHAELINWNTGPTLTATLRNTFHRWPHLEPVSIKSF